MKWRNEQEQEKKQKSYKKKIKLINGCGDTILKANIKKLIQDGASEIVAKAIAYKYMQRQGCLIPQKPKRKGRKK